MRHLSLALALLLTACATLPPPGKPALPDVQFRMRDFRLANGLRVLVEEDHGSPLVGVFTCVGVGSSGDPVGREGLAHLVEHLMFRNKADGKSTMWDRLEAAGIGELNAYTNFDNTMYYEVGSRDILDKILQIEAQRLAAPLAGIDEAVFVVEKEVVRNELRQRGETQIGPAMEWLQEVVFPKGSLWARPIGGSHDSLSTITLDDARRFVAQHYRPANMTMLVVGDVDLASVQDVLSRNLGSLWVPGGAQGAFPSRIPAAAKPPPDPPEAKLAKKRATVATPELYVAWSLPRGFGDDGVVQDFVRVAAGAELQQAWRSDPDIVDVGVFNIPGVDASMLVARAVLRKAEHPEKSLEHLLDQLVKLWASGEAGREYALTGAEAMVEEDRRFGRLRNGAVIGMTLEAENIASRGAERVVAAHFTGDPLMYGRRIRELAKVGPAQVAHFAEQYLTRARARAVLVEPLPPDAKEAAPAQVGLATVSAEKLDAPFTPEAVRALGRSRVARPNETVVHAAKDRSDETLANGLRVVVQRRHGLPIAVVQLAFPVGGAAASPPGAGELADMMAGPRGHRYGNPIDYGIMWSTGTSDDLTEISGRAANGNLPNMLAQLSERVAGVSVEGAALGLFKTDYLDYLGSLEELPQAKADRALKTALFGDHPLGRTVRVAEQMSIGASDITGWLERVYSPRGAVLVIAGDVDVDDAAAQARRWFSSWEAPDKPASPLPPVTLRADGQPRLQITHRPGATQAELRIACLAPGASTHEEFANGMVADQLGSTLFRRLREELGATYGVNGGARTLVGGTGRMEWRGALENGRLGPALQVLKKTWDDFEKEQLVDQAIGRARWQQAREATLQAITSETIATILSRWILLGRTPDDLDRAFEDLAAVSPEQLRASWAACKGNAVVSFVGDEATVQAAAKAAGF